MKILYRTVLFLLLSSFVSKSYAKFGSLTLGNQVWNDYNGDGHRDSWEPGIPNAPVSLYTDNNNDNLPDGPVLVIVKQIFMANTPLPGSVPDVT